MAETAGTPVTHISKNSKNGNHANVAIDLVLNGSANVDSNATACPASPNNITKQEISSNGDTAIRSQNNCNNSTNGSDLNPVGEIQIQLQSADRSQSSLSSKGLANNSMEETVPEAKPAAADQTPDLSSSSLSFIASSSPAASSSSPSSGEKAAAVSTPASSDPQTPERQQQATSSSSKGSKMTTGRSRPAAGHSVQSAPRRGHQQQQQQRQHQQLQGQGMASGGRMSSAPEMPLRVVVHSEMVGAIIGKSGNTIKDITKESKARVDVLRKDATGSIDKVINIFGSTDCCSKACSKIMQVIADEARDTDKNPEDYPLRLLAHNALIGRIIGKSGATIKRIMEATVTKVTISSNVFDPTAYNLPERVITIRGNDLISIIDAESQIFSKLRACYESDMAMAIAPSFLSYAGHQMGPMGHHVMPMGGMSSPGGMARGGAAGHQAGSQGSAFTPASMYGAAAFMPGPSAGMSMLPQYPMSPVAQTTVHSMLPMEMVKETAVIYIPNACVGAVIGTGGATIREMMITSGANIKVAQSPQDQERFREGSEASTGSRERKVTVTGTPEAQWKAQMLIFRKVLMDPTTSSSSSPSSSEPALRVEILVPSSQVGRIIGKNGQTVRELQRLTRAQIKLPEPAEEGTTPPAPDAETPVSIVGDFFSSQNAQRQIRALVSRGQMAASSMLGSAAYELTGMGFQRQRDEQRRPAAEIRGSKSKGSKSSPPQLQKQQSSSSQHSSQEERAVDPDVHSKEQDEQESHSEHSNDNLNSQAAAPE